MLGLGLSLQKGISAFNAGRALVSSYIRRVTEAGGVLQNTACDAAAINELNQDRLLEPASWVLVPDGIKKDVVYAQKPTSGLGDLSFSRASDATRVGPDGLIEKVRTNSLLNSQNFSAWTLFGAATRTTGVVDPNGGTTAATISNIPAGNLTDGIRLLSNPISASTGNPIRFSIYLKGSGTIRIAIERSLTGDYFYYPVVVTLTSTWTRYEVGGNTGNSTGAGVYVVNATGTTATSVDVAFGQIEIGDVITDYIPTTTAAVSVGPVANVPRLDYLGSTCPRLLLEPQRTNVALNSETFGSSTGTTIVLNNGTSPDGYVNADKLVEDTSTGVHISTIGGVVGGSVDSSVYSVSFFAKAAGRTRINVFDNNQATSGSTNFDISNGVVISGSGRIENYGNGWYRCIIFPAKTNSTSSNCQIRLIDSGTNVSYTGNGTSGVFLWGKQVEAGTYPTTYIPTTTAAVTRLADAASKTGVSSLIGQTEGTLFVDFVYSAKTGNNRFSISSGSTANWIFIGTPEDASTNKSRFYIRTNNTIQVDVGTTAYFTFGQRYKLALAYKSGSWAVYGNGTLLYSGTHSISAVSSPLSVLNFFQETGQVCDAVELMNQAALFPTRLSNDQLEVLTSEGYGTYALLAQSLNCVLQ